MGTRLPNRQQAVPVPAIIQRALGTPFASPNNGDVIRGLEGLFLTDYISIRSGKSRLNLLRSPNRHVGRLVAVFNTNYDAPKKNRLRRRKRKRKANDTDHQKPCFEQQPDSLSGAVGQGGSTLHRKKRVREREPQTSASSDGLDMVDLDATDLDRFDPIDYHALAKVVIAPFTNSLVAILNRCRAFEQDENSDENSDNETQPPPKRSKTTLGDDLEDTHSAKRAPGNVYRKSSSTSSTHSRDFITLSAPQETLENIVDGSVCTLVRRCHRMKSAGKTVCSKPTYNKPKCRVSLSTVHRRRHRKQSGSNQSTAGRSAKTHMSRENDWILERNILSTGYSLGCGETSFSSSKSSAATKSLQHQMCPNMAPGIHCLHPNSLTSFARSAPLMKLMHAMIGDDALREILVNAIVLVPCTDSGEKIDANSFDRCNYFQLCGPPLNVLAKMFESLSKGAGTKKLKKGQLAGKDDIAKMAAQSDQWNPNRPIPRRELFYNEFYNKRVGLSPNHLLNQPDADHSDINASSADEKLLDAMVHIWPGKKVGKPECFRNKRRKRWMRLRPSGIEMCREMRRRHRQCDYARLLENHCPLPQMGPGVDGDDSDIRPALSHTVSLFTPADEVGRFISGVLRRAFPSSFWGSNHNFAQVLKTILVFVYLGRNEQIAEKDITKGIRVLDFKWLRRLDKSGNPAKFTKTDHEATTTLVRNIMRWVYCQFIIPILRSTFYVTETEFTGGRSVYYRRPVWTRIKTLSMKLLLTQQYREVRASKAVKLLSSHNVLCPPAPMRLLPKKTGVRAISMLSKSAKIEGGSESIGGKLPPNKVLQSAFHALRYEHEKKPSLFGAGVLGLTEVFPAFCAFVDALREKRSRTDGEVPLYFTSVDIKHCYDTINQKRLYKLLQSVVKTDEYLTKNTFRLHSKSDSASLSCRWKKTTFSPIEFTHQSASQQKTNTFNSITVDGVSCSMDSKKKVLGLLRDHIFGQIAVVNGSFDDRYLLQKDGIPQVCCIPTPFDYTRLPHHALSAQGSILSSILCNIYFGDIEKLILGSVFGSSQVIRGSTPDCDVVLLTNKSSISLLVRIVDDFLLVSSDKIISTSFLQKLQRGIPRIGVKINSEKSRMNYAAALPTDSSNAQTRTRNLNFSWCGLLIDTRTCEVSLDPTRFAGSLATDTVVIHRTGSEGLNLKKKMKDFVRPRCSQKLLFSSCVNSLERIRLNFYEAFIICARKTCHYLQNTRVSRAYHSYIFDCACDTIIFAHHLITSKIKHDASRPSKFQLTKKDAMCIGKYAFFKTLLREPHLAQLGERFSCPRGRIPHYLEETKARLQLEM